MDALGIDLRSFLFQLGNFLILFGLLYYLLHKPLVALLDKRREEITEGLRNAEQARAQLAEAETQQQALLHQAEAEGRKIIQDVRERAEALEEKLKTEASLHAEQLLTEAKEEIGAEQARLRQELKGELATLVVTATEKVLREELTKEKRTELQKTVTRITS